MNVIKSHGEAGRVEGKQHWCDDSLRSGGEDQAGGVVQELADLRVVVWTAGGEAAPEHCAGSQLAETYLSADKPVPFMVTSWWRVAWP